MEKAFKEAQSYFDSLTRDELKDLLVEAGFEVEDGSGKVIFSDEFDKEFRFNISSKYEFKAEVEVEKTVKSFPVAC